MKRRGHKFWETIVFSFAAVFIVCLGSAIWFKYQLTSGEADFIYQIIKQYAGPILILGLFLMGVCGWAVESIFRKYVRPIRRIADEISLINPDNPSHRIHAEGGPEIEVLCRRLNEGAAHYESLIKNIDGRVRAASTRSEEERNILAAIMSELPEGVIVCNHGGRVLLYNNRAKILLAGSDNFHQGPGAKEKARYVGLGRSVFDIFNENLIRNAIDQISAKLEHDEPDVVAYFVSPGSQNSLLRVETIPVLDPRRHFTGFILILSDITRQLESHHYLNLTLQSFTRGIRASLAGIRAAIETILEYPQMGVDQLDALKNIIHKESLNIGDILEQDPTLSANPMLNQWPLVRVSVRNLCEMLQTRCQDELNIDVQIDDVQAEHFVNIDQYSFLLVLLFVIQKVQSDCGISQLNCRLTEMERFVGLDLLWTGPPLPSDTLREWEQQPLSFEKEGLALTLREVIDHHAAEIGAFASRRQEGQAYVRFFLPVVFLPAANFGGQEETRSLTILPESRPEFYDFDFFQQTDKIPELEERPLTDLTYTVFDLETTGLDPDGGDEILSVGAFRIVNCRLLQDENFDQLVDPRRTIPWTSVRIHGIHPEMLTGQPTINEVLPKFQKFATDTILVAHNAAFDMRFLQLKEEKTGVRFLNPVLDTLLLSAIIHPAHDDHNLEAIAQRLGVRILARHTAGGDAIATAEIFLKMLPLLAAKGIYTLKDAVQASQKTYYARKGY